MASWSTHKFGSSLQMTEFLNGAILGNQNVHNDVDVDGLTFIFEVNGGGNTTVTFAPPKSRSWTPAEIVALINVAEAGLAWIRPVTQPGYPINRRIKLEKDLVSLEVKNGTANALLGFVAATTADYVPDTEVKGTIAVPGEQDTWLLMRYA